MTLSRPRVGDALVALLAFALTLATLGGGRGGSRGLDAVGVVLAAAASFPLLARRTHPLEVFVVTAAASAAINGLGYGLGPPFGPTIALFFVALDPRTRDRLGRTAAVVLAMFAIHLGATALGSDGFPTTAILGGVVVWGGAWLIGDQVRQRRQRVAELVDRARRSEQERDRERRLAAAEERTRIARDLHDSAAHAINVILVQAGAARLLQNRNPAAVQTALATIEEVARETVTEIDRLVGALREDGRADGVEPPTGLAALETLLDRHRGAGLAVESRIVGEQRALPPALDQAAYRILQESLTNAARHGTGTAELEVVFGPERLELAVRNPLAGSASNGAPATGHGILGMRERAALLDGALEAGPAGDAFEVHASLPYASRSVA
jgi:signal transduction histidine kinase